MRYLNAILEHYEQETNIRSNNLSYNIITCVIFSFVSYTFLFPCNSILPLDRRTVAVVGALACYLTNSFIYPSSSVNLLHAIDFDVLVLLASIMVVNHIIIHLKETRSLVEYFQAMLKQNPTKGFWAISFVAFCASPFLTNDGVCLLLVQPILNAFKEENEIPFSPISLCVQTKNDLQHVDALYILLALACSSNIGSCLTYTGNPQNMIVASDSIECMPPYKFLVYMLLPSVLTWFITIKWIETCWKKNKQSPNSLDIVSNGNEINNKTSNKILKLNLSKCMSPYDENNTQVSNMLSPLSPRRKRAQEREKIIKHVVRVISSPLPYIVVALLIIMIIMIFVDLMPISALICIIAITMILTLVFGNYWRNHLIWEESSPSCHASELGPITKEDKVDNLNEFFEHLFQSIDYSLLLIFLGTFIVVESMAVTGIPKKIWKVLVGKKPFQTFDSILGISCFVIVASQLLGNVAVIQLAKPNIEPLEKESKRFAWALISFIATIGGNLTITGSAANIIVAEKANRMDSSIRFDFFRHYRVCFWITLVGCIIGGGLLTFIVSIDNNGGSNW